MRFALIRTGNTQNLIEALGDACDAIDIKKASGGTATTAMLNAIVERNVTRRKIRFPALFRLSPVASIYRAIYRRKVSRQYGALHAFLARDTSRTVLVFNGYLAPNALLAEAAKSLGMKMLFLENGFFPGTMQADRNGINGLSTLPRDAAFYDALTSAQAGSKWPDTFEVRKSKITGSDATDGKLPASYVFVPFQVPSDMQILALSPWIRDMAHLYDEIVALADAFPDFAFVIKEHPSFPISLQEAVTPHPRVLFANHANTRELASGADAVLTVNSTVGLEALTLGKKVVTLGNAHYAIDGLTLQADDRESLHKAFSRLGAWQPNAHRRETYIRFVFNRFLLPFSRTEPGADAGDILSARVSGIDPYGQAIAGRASS